MDSGKQSLIKTVEDELYQITVFNHPPKSIGFPDGRRYDGKELEDFLSKKVVVQLTLEDLGIINDTLRLVPHAVFSQLSKELDPANMLPSGEVPDHPQDTLSCTLKVSTALLLVRILDKSLHSWYRVESVINRLNDALIHADPAPEEETKEAPPEVN